MGDEFKYTTTSRAPVGHIDIAQQYMLARLAMVPETTIHKDIAAVCNTTPQKVRKVLRHQPIRDYIDRTEFINKIGLAKAMKMAEEACAESVEAVANIVRDPDAKPKDKLQAAKLIWDYTPTSPFQAKNRVEISHRTVADNTLLSDMRRRAADQAVQQLKVVDVEVVKEDDETSEEVCESVIDDNNEESAESSEGNQDCSNSFPLTEVGTVLEGVA